MKQNQKLKMLGMSLLVLFSVILVACGGRDISAVDNAIEGHWTVTDARVNGEPLADFIGDFENFLEIDAGDVTSTEQDFEEVAVDLYYNDGILTFENADGETSTLPYLVTEMNEENHTLTLEYHIIDEEIDITLNQMLTFNTENRDSFTADVIVVDVALTETASDENVSELEAGLNQIGEDIAREILQSLNIEFGAVYVDDAEAPADTNE